ncbi:hypothetical protein FPSE_11438 [Fusarium pseudograminearum CS3096]|uniref:F-box domain-containing protein n=1 Tax=Fusarium pseudograminearum (strain CS3096) TaxID=1028729 RepID=K3VX79_FUSPC|nr:hypothetical protein FPSE_11438 [Fusarium pseudograminearum CS3096]EKJ68430.1 hypothetical protein FPSE_11438 [Fusarium pseudograminearum CS3096]
MASSQVMTTRLLTELPADVLVKIFPLLPLRDAVRFLRTCKGLYKFFIQELYERMKNRFWIPLRFGCATGNIATIHRCLNQLGAPVDCYLPRDNGTHRWGDETYYVVGGWRPLREAMQRLHIEAIKLLLINGANPNTTAAEAASGQSTPPLAYAYRRGAESRRNVVKARAVCVLLVLAGADLRVLDPVKQLEVQIMTRVNHYIPASWR